MDQQKHRPFTSWTLLQNNQKWIDREFECPPKRPRSNCSSSADIEAHEEDEGIDEMSKRPAGRKKEKEVEERCRWLQGGDTKDDRIKGEACG